MTMDLMDTLVCVKPGELVVEPRPRAVRADGEVLVKPRRIGICGTDYHIYEGNQPFLSYPRVMGHELALDRKPELYHGALAWLDRGDSKTKKAKGERGERVARK